MLAGRLSDSQSGSPVLSGRASDSQSVSVVLAMPPTVLQAFAAARTTTPPPEAVRIHHPVHAAKVRGDMLGLLLGHGRVWSPSYMLLLLGLGIRCKAWSHHPRWVQHHLFHELIRVTYDIILRVD